MNRKYAVHTQNQFSLNVLVGILAFGIFNYTCAVFFDYLTLIEYAKFVYKSVVRAAIDGIVLRKVITALEEE